MEANTHQKHRLQNGIIEEIAVGLLRDGHIHSVCTVTLKIQVTSTNFDPWIYVNRQLFIKAFQ